MYLTNAAQCMPLKSTRLECRHFLQFFVYKVIQKKKKITTIHKALRCISNDRQIFHIHTVAFQSQDMQCECCVLKGIYYTMIRTLAKVN